MGKGVGRTGHDRRAAKFQSVRPGSEDQLSNINANTRSRLLTGADFDVESVQRMRDGSLWIGDKFGPYLLHVSRTGRVLSAHIPYLLRKSPQSSDLGGERPKARQSGGFEAMAKSRNGRYLYPILEKSLVSDRDPRRRVITEFDTRTRRYTGPRWNYRVDTDANLVADAQMIGGGRLLILERDDYESAGAAC